MNDPCHDYSIIGIRYEEGTLELSMRAEDQSAHVLCCEGAYFEFTEFQTQNVVLEIRSYDRLPPHLSECIDPYYIGAAGSGARIVEIDASTGLSGWVVAKSAIIRPVRR